MAKNIGPITTCWSAIYVHWKSFSSTEINVLGLIFEQRQTSLHSWCAEIRMSARHLAKNHKMQSWGIFDISYSSFKLLARQLSVLTNIQYLCSRRGNTTRFNKNENVVSFSNEWGIDSLLKGNFNHRLNRNTPIPTHTWRVARGRGHGEIVPHLIPKVAPTIFRSIKRLMCKPKKWVSANQRNCLKKLFFFNF